MSNHISETEYAQLTDSAKAGYREVWQYKFIGDGWQNAHKQAKEQFGNFNNWRHSISHMHTYTRLVYVPINPTPDREPEEKNNGWISVKDKLPPKDGVYLVYGSGFRDTPMQVLRANYYKKVFKADNFNGVRTKNVTHWMPLPSPPNI